MMPAHVQERIKALSSKVGEERKAIAELDAQIDLKVTLKPASHMLDDIESIFLSPETVKQPRTDRQWSFWLDNADLILKGAIDQRKYVAGLVEKVGPDAKLIGG